MHLSNIFAAIPLLSLATASPPNLDKRQLGIEYAPKPTSCPSSPLVRPAIALSTDEQAWVNSRYQKANTALYDWITKQGSFRIQPTSQLPVLALTTSGGGYRSMLSGGGVVQAFDSRDSNVSTSGLYQSLMYHSGLSGGGWLVSSIAGNDFSTISAVKEGEWKEGLDETLFVPETGFQTLVALAKVPGSFIQKENAGFRGTIIDIWGRLLAYGMLTGSDGGVRKTLSGIKNMASFQNHEMPFPIMTAADIPPDLCVADDPAILYEFHPFEFGSWDQGVKAFTPTQYLGSDLTNGQPTVSGKCISNFDNLGYMLGTTGSVFNAVCAGPGFTGIDSILTPLNTILSSIRAFDQSDLFALWPNPFKGYAGSPAVSSQEDLKISDTGFAWQNQPIWPLLQPQRDVDVVFVNNNGGDDDDLFPTGVDLRQTYLAAQEAGLSKMPFIPEPADLIAAGARRAWFFGCDEREALTIIYLPNNEFTFDSGTDITKLKYSNSEVDGMVANGMKIATQNDEPDWGFCVACGILKKQGGMPSSCKGCFKKYCWK